MRVVKFQFYMKAYYNYKVELAIRLEQYNKYRDRILEVTKLHRISIIIRSFTS
jgi:hypothetical protein